MPTLCRIYPHENQHLNIYLRGGSEKQQIPRSLSNSSGVGSTEELSKEEKSQKLNCIQLISKSAFHRAAYFVGSAFSFIEH